MHGITNVFVVDLNYLKAFMDSDVRHLFRAELSEVQTSTDNECKWQALGEGFVSRSLRYLSDLTGLYVLYDLGVLT